MKIRAVLPGEVDAHWPHIQPYLERACARTGWTTNPQQLYLDCRAGNAVYILALDVEKERVRWAAVIGFYRVPEGGVAYTKAFGGEKIEDWASDFDVYAEWAKSTGVRFARFDGPKAYEKKFLAAKVLSQSYEVDLSE